MAKESKWKRIEDLIARLATGGCACISLLALGLIAAFLLREGASIFASVSPGALLGGREWFPTSEPPSFGLLPMIAGSALVTAGALALAVPLGIAVAIFVAEVAPTYLRDPLKVVVEILAGIPSVVYGFFGLLILSPWLQGMLGLPTGQTALTASLILGIMALPTVASITEDAIVAVPDTWREASLALGATRWQTILGVVLPAAKSGLSAAIVLGLGRAVGETMAVLMVSGNSPLLPPSPLRPVRTLTATLALEMAEAVVGSPHYHALFAAGGVLFLFTLALNLAGELVGRRVRRGR